MAAPSSLSGLLSNLSATFELLGRNGHWDEQARTGNPILSKAVSTFKDGYRRMQLRALSRVPLWSGGGRRCGS